MPKVYLLKLSRILVYVALIGSVTAVVHKVPFFAILVFISALMAGFILDHRSYQNPILDSSSVILFVLMGIFFSFVGINDQNFFGRILGILLIIISAKLVAPKKSRDMLQIYLLNFLVLVSAAVIRWGVEFGLLVLAETFVSITGLLFLYGSDEKQEIPVAQVWHLVRRSSLITLCLIPATMFFFLILPRPSGSFFAWGGRAATQSGFSDRVTPGDVEQIKVDDSPAFRVKWLTGNRPPRPLWRGIVYDSYYGGIWEKRYKIRVGYLRAAAQTVGYEILLEPTHSKYLLSYGLPVKITLKSGTAQLVSGYTLKVPSSIQGRILYQVESYALPAIPPDLPPYYYLQIPEGIRQKLSPLAKGMVRKTVFQTAKYIESFLKTQYSYDLSPGEARGDPVSYFLSTGRKGHCEYFASAMVLLLRNLEIPSRVVGGYAGGDWNELGQYYLVRQSDAHTWVEVWIEKRGWVAFDPTPEVPVREKHFLKVKVFRFIDFLRMKWYYWVLDYDSSRQQDLARKTASLLRSLGSGDKRLSLNLKALYLKKIIPLLIFVALVVCFKMAKSYFHARPKSWGERFVSLFQRHGYHKRSGETLLEFATKIANTNASLGEKTSRFVKHYYTHEYGEGRRERILHGILKEIESDLK